MRTVLSKLAFGLLLLSATAHSFAQTAAVSQADRILKLEQQVAEAKGSADNA